MKNSQSESLVHQNRILLHLLSRTSKILIDSFTRDFLSQTRYDDPKKLTRFGRKIYSQYDEDGIIAEIFRRIGTRSRTFVEIGSGDGKENNTSALLLSGWSGLWIDADEKNIIDARQSLRSYVNKGLLTLKARAVKNTAQDDKFLSAHSINVEPDILSIDIDGDDYWIWEALTILNPRVVVIEYNAAWPPPLAFITPYAQSTQSNYFGASLSSLVALGKRKGYTLVGCGLAGINAFFVRNDELQDSFSSCGVEEHYEPARYWLFVENGHTAGIGPIVQPSEVSK